MTKKELKAVITLAGKIDPSLQSAMLKASKETSKLTVSMKGSFALMWQSLKQGPQMFVKTTQTVLKTGLTNAMANMKGTLLRGVGAAFKAPFKLMGTLLKGVGIAALAGTVAASAAFVQMGRSGLEYASDLQEVQNVVDKTFGENSAIIDEFASKSLEAYGLSTLEAKKYSSTVGAMLKSMGLSSDETLVMSQNLTALSGDMASFYNLSGDEAFEKIRAGISGETEPLKQLGINMSVANLEAYALSQGITKSFNSMSQADQAILRYNYLMSLTSDAQGDFGDTQESFANQQRLLKGNLQEVSGEIMQNMLPALAGAMKEANGFIKSLDTAAIGQFVGSLADMAVAFMPLVMDLMPLFGNLIGMIMPPLLQIGQAIIPIIVQVVQTLMQVLEPLIPPIMQFVQVLLPPLQTLLTAISPLLTALANLLGNVLGPVLKVVGAIFQAICDLIAAFAKPITDFINGIVNFFGGGGKAQEQLSNVSASDLEMQNYALGGFSARPAIFGEAGLEAAIPIKPGNPRSIGLLQRTAQLLGIGTLNEGDDQKQEINFTYAPVIYAEGDTGPVEQMLRRGAAEMRRMIEDFFSDRGRLAWE